MKKKSPLSQLPAGALFIESTYSWEKIDFRSICGNVLLDYSSVRDYTRGLGVGTLFFFKMSVLSDHS